MDDRALEPLISSFRSKAEAQLSRDAAAALYWAADELERYIRAWIMEPITVRQAARETNYSVDKIRRDIKAGRIENVGEEGKPRVMRRDLTWKPPRRCLVYVADEGSLAGKVLQAQGLAVKRRRA